MDLCQQYIKLGFFFFIFKILLFLRLGQVLVAASGIFTSVKIFTSSTSVSCRFLIEAHRLFSCGNTGSRVCRLSSCSLKAYLLHGMWDLSSSTRDQTLIPCIARPFLTTRPRGKSRVLLNPVKSLHGLSRRVTWADPHFGNFILATEWLIPTGAKVKTRR